jgi:hypothetical protein
VTIRIDYREQRRWGYPAFSALWLVRADAALAAVDDGETVCISWQYDQEYEVEDTDMLPEYVEEERAKLASGEWDAWYCSITKYGHCDCCGSKYEISHASLGGIVLGQDRQSDYYRRSIECELAVEADIIDNPRIWKRQP